MRASCNIGEQDVVVTRNAVICSGWQGYATVLSVYGTTKGYLISVTDSDLVLQLEDVDISASFSTLSVSASTVRLVFIGSNRLETTTNAPGLRCDGQSNITLLGGDAASSAVFGADLAIGTIRECRSIELRNGTYATGYGLGTASSRSSLQTLIITDAHVTAYGGGRFPGIGCSGDESELRSLVITGGRVDVWGGDGAAIGPRLSGASIGSVLITGGNVTATGGESGAGIGASGCSGYGHTSWVGNVTIVGGNVNVSGGTYAAGIGTGPAYDVGHSGHSGIGDVIIAGGNVNARGGSWGAGIGAAYAYQSDSISRVAEITIVGGNVTATGGQRAAGIGAGYAETSGGSTVERVTIANGNLTATAGGSAVAIGSGSSGSSVSGIFLIGGRVRIFSSSSGIGDVPARLAAHLMLRNAIIDCNHSAGPCFSADKVTFGDGSTVVVAPFSPVLDSRACEFSAGADLYIEYSSTTYDRERSFAGTPLLHIGSVVLPSRALYALTVRPLRAGGEPPRTHIFDPMIYKGFAFSVGSIGDYTISFESVADGFVGYLQHSSTTSFNAVEVGDNFFETASYLLVPTATPSASSTSQFSDSPSFSVSDTHPASQTFAPTDAYIPRNGSGSSAGTEVKWVVPTVSVVVVLAAIVLVVLLRGRCRRSNGPSVPEDGLLVSAPSTPDYGSDASPSSRWV